MTATLFIKAGTRAQRDAASRALREAGIGVMAIDDWERAAEEMRECEAALVIADPKVSEADASRLARAIALLDDRREGPPSDPARALSHDLRTPLSAMAGWVHLLETGKLDEAGIKRALGKLRGNIEDQVRMIERHLGTTTQEGTGR
jgi:signal transduction histidine kinase